MVYIYLHLVYFYGFHVGKYTSPMDGMGNGMTLQDPMKPIGFYFFQIPKLALRQRHKEVQVRQPAGAAGGSRAALCIFLL